MNRVYIRTYCEAQCDCPTCHDGKHTTEVENCVYCQIKWFNCGQYNEDWLAEHPEITHKETKAPVKRDVINAMSDDDVLEEVIKEWKLKRVTE